MERMGALHLACAGDACLEIAIVNPEGLNTDARLEWFERAKLNWEKSVIARGNYLEADSGMALVQLSKMSAYSWLILENRLPPANVVKQNYAALIEVQRAHLEARQEKLEGRASKKGIEELVGNIAEITVGLMIDRFAMRELQDSSMLALPSLRTQNKVSSTRGAPIRGNWDVSVFSAPELETPPELAYRLQIKSSQRAANLTDCEYDPSVTLVTVSSDLALGDRAVRTTFIANQLVQEADGIGGAETSTQLDRRANELLNLMG